MLIVLQVIITSLSIIIVRHPMFNMLIFVVIMCDNCGFKIVSVSNFCTNEWATQMIKSRKYKYVRWFWEINLSYAQKRKQMKIIFLCFLFFFIYACNLCAMCMCFLCSFLSSEIRTLIKRWLLNKILCESTFDIYLMIKQIEKY